MQKLIQDEDNDTIMKNDANARPQASREHFKSNLSKRM
jgi:hypothetical protein